MKAFVSVKKAMTPWSLKRELHRKLRRRDVERPRWYLHASDVTREKPLFCVREKILNILEETDMQATWLETSMSSTFANGRMWEKRIREDWLGHIAVGIWECRYCRQKTLPFSKRPKVCPTAGCHGFNHPRFRYHEQLFGEDPGIGCAVDLMVQFGTDITLCEIKTIDKDYFRDLKAPMSEHTHRMRLTLNLVSRTPNIPSSLNLSYGHILYVGRCFGMIDKSLAGLGCHDKFSPFKEFTISRNDDELEDALTQEAYWVAWRTHGTIPAGICTGPADKRSKDCPVRKTCFGLKYPPGDSCKVEPPH